MKHAYNLQHESSKGVNDALQDLVKMKNICLSGLPPETDHSATWRKVPLLNEFLKGNLNFLPNNYKLRMYLLCP